MPERGQKRVRKGCQRGVKGLYKGGSKLSKVSRLNVSNTIRKTVADFKGGAVSPNLIIYYIVKLIIFSVQGGDKFSSEGRGCESLPHAYGLAGSATVVNAQKFQKSLLLLFTRFDSINIREHFYC